MMKWINIVLIIIININILNSAELRGIVRDFDTKKTIFGASIKVLNSLKGTYSKANGSFKLNFKRVENLKLIISFIGYKSDTVDIRSEDFDKEIIVELRLQDINAGEIVVTANKKVQLIQDVPISMSVINQQEIILRNSTDIDKILNYIPGIKMNGGQVSIRGTSGFAFGLGSRVAMLLDGMPVLSADQGDMKFDIIPSFIIERVEVVKGAGSALYGSSALGGVVNLITTEYKDNARFNFKLYSGIYTQPKYKDWQLSNIHNKSGLDLSYSDNVNDANYLVAGRLLSDESYREFDDRLNYSIFSRLKYKINNNDMKLLLSFTNNDHADWVYWESLNEATKPPDDTELNNRVNSKKLSLFFNDKIIFLKNSVLDLKFGIYNTNFRNNTIKREEIRQSEATSYYSEIQFSNKFFEKIFSTQGLNLNYNVVNSSIYSGNNQFIGAGYWQLEWDINNNIIVTAGARMDYEKTSNSSKNLEFSPKFGVNYKLSDNTTVRASFGKGFRTATIAEKFATINFDPFKVKPNADLLPEENYSFELGFNNEFQFANTLNTFDFSIFQNNLNNMIEPSFINSNGELFIQFLNVQDAVIRGFEIDLKSLILGFISFKTSLTYLNTKDLKTKLELKYRSNWQSTNSISIDFDNFKIQSDYRFLSKSDEVDSLLKLFIPNADARVNSHIVDFRIIVNMEKYTDYDFDLILNIENALDYYYTEYPGNLGPTRYISLIFNGSI